jgi:hypothetical protein
MSQEIVDVLDTSEAARTVAQRLGLQAVAYEHLDPEQPVLAVVANANEVAGFLQLREACNLLALVSWNLPEGELLRLVEGDVPVLVGLPSAQQLRELIWWGESPVSNLEERQRTARLAVLEDSFGA